MNDQERYWRSLAEHATAPELAEASPEFQDPLEPPSTEERRHFLKLTAASVALVDAGST